MKIWVDGDACPAVIKEILYRAAERTQLKLIVVANRKIKIPASPFIENRIVPQGLDGADDEIVRNVGLNDLVITSDIPLAARVIEKGGVGLNPRGEMYTADTIGERLSARDFMDMLRSSGVETGGPSVLSKKDRHVFANSLDTIIKRHKTL